MAVSTSFSRQIEGFVVDPGLGLGLNQVMFTPQTSHWSFFGDQTNVYVVMVPTQVDILERAKIREEMLQLQKQIFQTNKV